MEPNRFVLMSSPDMHPLGDLISGYLEEHGVGIPHHKMGMDTFANGELMPRIKQTIRGQHVFFLHALQFPDPNIALMGMLIANDAMMRASACGITPVIPFIPYLRQDRKDAPRVPITARLIADLIESNRRVTGIITTDMHAEQEPGFFSIPVDNLSGTVVFREFLQRELGGDFSNTILLAPDFGGAVRNRRLAKELGGLPVSIFEKRHVGTEEIEHISILGESIVGKTVVIYEDMICSARTGMGVLEKVLEMGVERILYLATHGIFSRNAEERFRDKGIMVVTTDSIPRTPEYLAANPWLTQVTLAYHFARVIHEATVMGGSVSRLEKDWKKE